MVIERHSFASKKISFLTFKELVEKINKIDGEVISMHQTIPDSTDSKHWISIYYKYNI